MSTNKKIAIGVVGVAGAAALVAGTAVASKGSLWNERTTRTQFTASVHRVVVDGYAGDVDVSASRATGAEVERTTSWLFSKPKVSVSVRDGVLYLEARGKHGFLSATDFKVRVPAGAAVEIDEHASDVTVTGKPGDVRADTDAGDVRVDVAHAPRRIVASSNAGDVTVEVPQGTYAVDTDTNAGDTSIRGVVRDDRAKRSIHATTDAGDVTVTGR